MNFTATEIEAFEDSDLGVITTHFDTGAELYLQFQGALPGFEEDYYDSGYVYLEIIDQAYGGYDCFEKIVVERNLLRVVGIMDERIKSKADEISVTFDADDDTFEKVVASLKKSFRDCRHKLEIEPEGRAESRKLDPTP